MTELERVQRIEEAIYSLAKDSEKMVTLLERIFVEIAHVSYSLEDHSE